MMVSNTLYYTFKKKNDIIYNFFIKHLVGKDLILSTSKQDTNNI